MSDAVSLVAVHSLDSFRLAVPSLDEAEKFFTVFGLSVERDGNRLLLRTRDLSHVWAEITRGERKKLLSVKFGIFEKDFSAFEDGLADITSRRAGASIWCNAPDGLEVEIAVAPKTSPDVKPSFSLAARGEFGRGAIARSKIQRVHPRRLAHVAIYAGDVQKATDFYCNRLGLRVADRSGNDVAFIYSPHGSDHHLIALARSNGPGLHHSSWDVETFDDVGVGAAQMMQAGYKEGWGVGRHVLGSNYFYYARDPWGSYAEYSADMDHIPAHADWTGGDHPGEDAFYLWGPNAPDDFVNNFELAEISA